MVTKFGANPINWKAGLPSIHEVVGGEASSRIPGAVVGMDQCPNTTLPI